jgi:hypothetical protein
VGNTLLHAFPKPLQPLEAAPFWYTECMGVNILKIFPCFKKADISRIQKLEFLMMSQLRMNEKVETRREN